MGFSIHGTSELRPCFSGLDMFLVGPGVTWGPWSFVHFYRLYIFLLWCCVTWSWVSCWTFDIEMLDQVLFVHGLGIFLGVSGGGGCCDNVLDSTLLMVHVHEVIYVFLMKWHMCCYAVHSSWYMSWYFCCYALDGSCTSSTWSDISVDTLFILGASFISLFSAIRGSGKKLY